MRKALFLSIFALCAAPALGAETAQCDATAFTLKKPTQPAAKADKPQPKAQIAQGAPAKAEPKKKTTTRLISDCKDGEKQPRG
jgi:hypothetical protein